VAVSDVISFGPYRLIPAERLLLKEGEVVNLGSRALDILVALAETAGDVISQSELIARAWPNLAVGEGSLRVTIAGLRKTLSDGQDGVRYISNVTGRGYCFVAQIERSTRSPTASIPLQTASGVPPPSRDKLPARLARMIGRDGAVEALSVSLASRRFVSVVGPGGLGKTTVAVAVAHALLDDFGDAVHFVDLSAINDPTLVPSTVATVLGVSVQAQDPLPSLLAFLAGRRILLVLDSCEHVIDAAASLTARLYSDAPKVHLLTTSRESLRVEGEHVHLLAPLDYPAAKDDLTAAEALASPAVQLFMERAFASGYALSLTDVEAPAVASICRQLDGIALAIELAGSRVGAYGLRGTSDLLRNRFKLLWQGRRSALPRHQTLHAMLDWSYNLLTERDRRVLDRLSIFVGVFTLEAAQAIASDDRVNAVEVADAIDSLIDKSLLWIAQIDGVTHHRLLDTTRAFAGEKLGQAAEALAVARLHALHYAQRPRSLPEHGVNVSGGDLADLAPHIGNFRAALEWSFSRDGDPAIGVRLAAATAPLFIGLSLLVECRRWCEQALADPTDGEADMTNRLALQEALAFSSMFTLGNGDDVRRAIEEGLRLAEALGDRRRQLNLLAGLHIFLTRISDFRGAVAVAERSVATAHKIGSPGAIATAEWMLGVAHHLRGNQALGRRHCENGLSLAGAADGAEVHFFGYDHRIRALIALARALWLSGFPDRAAKIGRQAMDEAVKRDHPVNMCMAMIYTSTVLLWRGDFDDAAQRIQRLVAHAARHSLGPYHAVGLALTGELAIARGDPAEGIPVLRNALGLMQAEQYHVLTTAFHCALAEGLIQIEEIDEATVVIDAALARSEALDELSNVSELLRVRGEVWLRTTPADSGAAENAFQRSREHAKGQSALSLELRSTIALAQLWSGQGKTTDAVELLDDIYRRFSEGHDTVDLRHAGHLLATLGRHCGSPDTANGTF
jgi:predicted ATPase/DNA-binding winged helix-turn-helix (wHTH) protein